jgi:hypothetical protein
MKIQNYLCVALTAQLSAAGILQKAKRALVRRQIGDGASPSGGGLSSLMSGLFGGTGTVSGVLSGYSIASTFVTAVNCKFDVEKLWQRNQMS